MADVMLDVKIGDRVKVLPLDRQGGPAFDAVVMKIGRKYVTVDAVSGYPRGVQFSIETGREYVPNYSGHRRLVTPEIEAAEARRAEVIEALAPWTMAAGFGRVALDLRKITTDDLEKIVAILAPEADEGA